jgi:hypothetical protein
MSPLTEEPTDSAPDDGCASNPNRKRNVTASDPSRISPLFASMTSVERALWKEHLDHDEVQRRCDDPNRTAQIVHGKA